MKNIALMIVIAGFALTGCAPTRLEADYGRSVTLLTNYQVYDRATLTRPSLAAVESADPDMLNLAVTTMRTQATDRKDVAKPIVLSIGGQGDQ
jgi:hypothetical protein